MTIEPKALANLVSELEMEGAAIREHARLYSNPQTVADWEERAILMVLAAKALRVVGSSIYINELINSEELEEEIIQSLR